MIKRLLFYSFILSAIILSSCSKYQKLLKSTDNDLKYETAMDFFEKKDYNRSLELFDLLQAAFRGTSRGEEISYRMAYCYFHLKDYTVASFYFKKHAQTYPTSARAEECMFMNAYCYYLDSPKPSLDQANTNLAIKELQSFTDMYPKSERVAESNKLIDDLRAKLEQKDYNIAILYYKMRDYQAAITSFQNLMKKYPDTERNEEILQNMVLANYEYAEGSIPDKQQERYEAAVEAYNNLRFQYPESLYLKSLEPIHNKARNKIAN
ncbi:MAG: outer membrane protein assembly factor BamD [Bacteroidetes bacterium HGW-Bacteroidetes-1]|nr:MAG: outer membrane protein assembly factor BamD [Bacteroidetes bacterium HGW-Bacteroidetes-1]